jgi:lipopolysaccharide biosynthesis glycosyltransferase
MEFARDHPTMLTWSDQCALNRVFESQWHSLDEMWNYQYNTFIRDVRRFGRQKAIANASDTVFHFNNYDRPWLPESAHPLKGRYMAIARAHSELAIPGKVTARAFYKRLKRALKWRLIASKNDRLAELASGPGGSTA